MRQLTDHIVSGDQAVQVRVIVLDEPGHGGACHQYAIDTDAETSDTYRRSQGKFYKDELEDTHGEGSCRISFQNGPIKEFGVNGITQEALLAIVIDRLRGFQNGPFSCADNQEALENCVVALECLQRRTLARIARGVEGTNQK